MLVDGLSGTGVECIVIKWHAVHGRLRSSLSSTYSLASCRPRVKLVFFFFFSGVLGSCGRVASTTTKNKCTTTAKANQINKAKAGRTTSESDAENFDATAHTAWVGCAAERRAATAAERLQGWPVANRIA